MIRAFQMKVIVFFFLLGISAQLMSDVIIVPRYAGDFNSDGMVLLDDLCRFSGQWLQIPDDPSIDLAPPAGDGIVNLRDFAVLSGDWFKNSALPAAQSGMQYALEIIAGTPSIDGGTTFVTDDQADTIWNNLCLYLQAAQPGGQTVADPTVFSDPCGSGSQIVTLPVSCGVGDVSFSLRFYRYDADPRSIFIDVSGTNADICRILTAETKIKNQAGFAVIARTRIALEGNTIVNGDIFTLWDRAEISPFYALAEICVLGTWNTVLTREQMIEQAYQLETLDQFGNPVFDEYGNRIVSEYDEIRGYHEGIHYGPLGGIPADLPGLDISDYNTDTYQDYVLNEGNGDIPASGTIEAEYFPHAADDFSSPLDGSSRKLNRHVYENTTFTNTRLPSNHNALFRNCTFKGVLYIDCSKDTSGYYNNVRFESCTFNGIIVTDTPSELEWRYNTLYFTGSTVFDNRSSINEAIVLAPHFNIELGDTNVVSGEISEITASGVIVGGIVDVHGNARIVGKIVSMCDTTQWSAGYVTNIGEYETGNMGTIEITAPSGELTPVTITPIRIYEKE